VTFIPVLKIKKWKRLLVNFLLNSFTDKIIPYSAQLEVTLRCNAKCPFCTFPTITKEINYKELSTQQFIKLISDISDVGIKILTFTGGEPTLRKDLPTLVYHAGVKNDLITSIATNGYLMPELLKVKKLVAGLDYLLLSLDYPIAELHDKSRGIKIFEKVMKTIDIALKKDIKVIISTVVMKDNMNLLEDICELTNNLGISIELYPCENIIRDFPNKSYYLDSVNKLIPDLNIWAEKMMHLRKKYNNILTDPISIEVIKKGGFGANSELYQNILRCHVAETHLFVRYDGYIDFPCKIHPLLSINALKFPISKIYQLKEVRSIINKRDGFPFCNGCRLGCAITSSLTKNWISLLNKYILGYLRGNLN